jgi:hypothetical protein
VRKKKKKKDRQHSYLEQDAVSDILGTTDDTAHLKRFDGLAIVWQRKLTNDQSAVRFSQREKSGRHVRKLLKYHIGQIRIVMALSQLLICCLPVKIEIQPPRSRELAALICIPTLCIHI